MTSFMVFIGSAIIYAGLLGVTEQLRRIANKLCDKNNRMGWDR